LPPSTPSRPDPECVQTARGFFLPGLCRWDDQKSQGGSLSLTKTINAAQALSPPQAPGPRVSAGWDRVIDGFARLACRRNDCGRSQALNSSSNLFASFRSRVLNPSVNHPYTGAGNSRASSRLPRSRHSRARLVAARSSNSFAGWRCATAIASRTVFGACKIGWPTDHHFLPVSSARSIDSAIAL
jgi:hypothetical protein